MATEHREVELSVERGSKRVERRQETVDGAWEMGGEGENGGRSVERGGTVAEEREEERLQRRLVGALRDLLEVATQRGPREEALLHLGGEGATREDRHREEVDQLGVRREAEKYVAHEEGAVLMDALCQRADDVWSQEDLPAEQSIIKSLIRKRCLL